MKVLVLGGGMQGRAVLHDLARCTPVRAVTCADVAVDRVRTNVARLPGNKVEVVHLDATDPVLLSDLMGKDFDVVIDMLPRQFARPVAEAAVAVGVHLVSSHYDHDVRHLADRAADVGVALLPEMGMDPGIDLVLAGEAVRRFDQVRRLDSYGGGIPEPGADDNPLRYKISWAWDGVLASYVRPARLVREAQIVEVPGHRIFEEEHIHTLEVEPLGVLEVFPNGDAAGYARKFGIEKSARTVGRYAVRWPGHARVWRLFAHLGFLEDRPVPSLPSISPRQFMGRHLEPRLQYKPAERDVVIIRIVAEGEGHHWSRLVLEVIDYGDPQSGLMAMNRTVGFPASIAAQMIVRGVIKDRGLLTPTRNVPYQVFVAELRERGITVREAQE